ncbi:MAG: helix-turn-helix domain-containing protein, partial [Solirubrobacteraceae bacterium]|nr:helix-turn-helix domain-containing protein [Solirubrobacteraceae bacterium]
GPAVAGWDDAGEALRDAACAAALAAGEPARPWHDASVPGLRHLLWRLRDDARVRAFAARRLAPVLEHDAARHGAPLLPTLGALCDSGWHKAQAARALHLERQSIYPRLERLRALLAADLDDPQTQAALHVAVLVQRLGGV